MTVSPGVARIFVLAVLVFSATTPLFAQAQGQVTRQNAVIWRADVAIAATVVPLGTIVTVTRDLGEFYEIVIPEQFGGRGERGRIAKTALLLVTKGPIVPQAPTERPATPPTRAGTAQQIQSKVRREPFAALRGFGQFGYTSFAATQSFDAILGESQGFIYGGGVQVRFRNGLYVDGSVERFKKDGHAVFVFEDTVYELGTPNTVTITPLTISGGFRMRSNARTVPFIAAGLSQYRLQETTPFTTADEEYDQRSTGFHVAGGVDLRAARWVSTAVELRYTRVSDAIGGAGVSDVFGERDLGGIQFHLKLLFGR